MKEIRCQHHHQQAIRYVLPMKHNKYSLIRRIRALAVQCIDRSAAAQILSSDSQQCKHYQQRAQLHTAAASASVSQLHHPSLHAAAATSSSVRLVDDQSVTGTAQHSTVSTTQFTRVLSVVQNAPEESQSPVSVFAVISTL